MTLKHKNENVFKFKKFSERIAEVDLRSSALYKIEHVNEIPDENRSYFYQTFDKWSTLNLAEEYVDFEKQIRKIQTATLPQVLHHKEKLVEILLYRLETSSILSLQPLLELTVSLARDLREEFYTHFQKFFEVLLKLLETKDADQTEWTLVCLAHLFKVLKPFLCKEISIVIAKVIPLMSEKDQPDHIINFAVECFAFIVRSLKDKNAFLLTVLRTIKQDESCITGCGKLFFEMVRGLSGQFHSKAEEFLEILFDAFRKNEYRKYKDILKEILVQTVGDILCYIDVKYISTYWNVIYKTFDNIIKDENLSCDEKSTSVHYVLFFLGQSIEYYGGKKLTDVQKTINLVIQVIDQDYSFDVMMTLSQIGALLLLSKNFMIGQLEASRLAKKILSTEHAEVFESFVINSIGCAQFDILIMPDFIRYFEKNFSKQSMEIMAKIIETRKPNGLLEASEFDGYNIYFKNQKTVDRLANFVKTYSTGDENCEEFLLSIKILPHLVTFDRAGIAKKLKKICMEILDRLRNENDSKLVFIFAVCASTIESISGEFESTKVMEIINVMLTLQKSYPIVKIINYFVRKLKEQNRAALNLEVFKKVRVSLVDNLHSQYQGIRLLTAQILSSFEHLKISKESIYTIFRDIEDITPTIQTYRDQILLLQKLNFDSSQFQDIKDTEYVEDCIKFCLGFLHVNFQLLWDPVRSVIESYAANIDVNVFWKIFYQQLKNVKEITVESDESVEKFCESELINSTFEDFTVIKDRYDPISYRAKLWQVLSDTKTNIHDLKQKDIVELFFDFLKNEYEIDDESSENEAPKGRQKLLISHLQVFAKFTNPKCVTRTNELRELYLELLLHRNFLVQKLALDSIVQYKEPAVINYKDLLYNCVNEKTFRQEIMSLNLNEKIDNEYRDGFAEIFLPILYSKMTIKAGKKDQEGFRTKKEVIVRFMNHLKEQELMKLTDISIGKIATFCATENCMEILESIKNSKTTFKVNELQSKLQFLDLIKKNVAGAFGDKFQRKMLRSILAIACCTVDNEGVMFKSLKQASLNSIVEFFEQYESFEWTADEVELVFEIFIWKHLETFSRDASQNVTGLMKLFVEWSKNPKYFKYLERTDANGNYPIKSIIGLVTNKSTTGVVIDCVMNLLERLLTMRDENEVITTVNYGTRLIEPFIQEILMKLKNYLRVKQAKMLNPRNLVILSRVTELVKDKESSKLLLNILFPLTLRKVLEDQGDSEGITKLLTTISNLLKTVDDPQSYLSAISPLFEHIHEVNLRKFLVKVFNLIAVEDENLREIVNDLNAYDRRWIEQPDFEKKLSAFHRLEKQENVSIELAVIVVYHCFYFLKKEKDLGIRDNSSHHLKIICSKVVALYENDKQQIDYFFDKIILNLIQKKIAENAEMRTEAILLLGELARNYPKVHPIFEDLHSLTDSHNRELDFFDNITHLQKFRHMKALRRFVDIAKTYKASPNLRTLNDFLLPISRIFLCADEYQRKSKVIEAAIEYVSCICKFLPWNQYEIVLKFYIRKMMYDSKSFQKQLVKLIPAILDGFHFTLTNINDENIVEIPQIVDEKDILEEEITKTTDSGDDEEIDEDENQPHDDMQTEVNEEIPAIEKITTLRANVSQRVIRSLTRQLIPSLFRILSQLSNTTAHKENKEERRLKEKQDMIKIPLALPIMKLLQKLPPKFLQQYLSQVVLKVSSFLKSTLKQVRATARHTLKEILITLGVEHLQVVIENLSGILSKGFQLHVLSITVHTLIDALKSQLVKSNVTDKILQRVLDICFNDIFGKNNEEQEIGKIGDRTPEAKPSRKSFLTLNILASTLGEKCILDFLMPFKNLLQETQSKRTVMKIQECLVQIASGFTVNEKIPIDALMILIHGTISESIPNLLPAKKKPDTKEVKKVDCLILAEEPKRRGASAANKNVKSSKQTNSYALVEFGLDMLHTMLKKKKLDNMEGFLDPLVPYLVDSLKGNFLKVNMLAVRCFTIMWHNKIEIENLKLQTESVTKEIFSILHKYATTEISRKDNHYLLVKSSFKSVVVLIRHVNYYNVNENQLKTLLLYIEQDLTAANDKDTISFVLLKAILDKKLVVPEIHEVLRKIAELSITSEIAERRNAIRPIVLTYLMEYPLGKKIDQLLKFFIAQLNYEDISGRESVIEMMNLIFKQFPPAQLCKFAGLFFLSLGTRLVNDESPACREKIALAIELLIKQLTNESRQQLFDITTMLLKEKKLVHREMAAQLITRFINASEKDFIQTRISSSLKLLLKSISNADDEPGQFVRVNKRQKLHDDSANGNDTSVIDERDQQIVEDHHLIQTLNAIIKIFEFNEGKLLKDESNKTTIDEIGYKMLALLPHDHTWVRLRSLKILNILVKNLNTARIKEVLTNDETVMNENDEIQFLHSKSQFQSFAFDLAVQLKPGIEQDLLDAILENLIEISKILKDIQFGIMIDDKKDFNLLWLIRRLRYAVHAEVAATPSNCLLRKAIFHFFNDLMDIIDRKILMKLASSILTPMLREMVEGEHVIEELKQIAMQVGNRIKTLIGLQEYDKIRMELQSKMLRKRVDRRKSLAQEKINNPVKAAARTIRKQLKKNDSKKRKRKEIQDGIFLPKKRKVYSNSMADTYE